MALNDASADLNSKNLVAHDALVFDGPKSFRVLNAILN